MATTHCYAREAQQTGVRQPSGHTNLQPTSRQLTLQSGTPGWRRKAGIFCCESEKVLMSAAEDRLPHCKADC